MVDEVSHVLLRIALDGRTASSSLDGPTDDEGLARLVDNVIAAARVAPKDQGWPGVTAATDGVDVDHWDEATAAATPDERAARVRAFVDAAGGLETAGACSTEAIQAAFANSAGHTATGRATEATIDGIARTATADGAGRSTSARLGDIDGAAAGREAAERARAASDPVDLDPGRYAVILGPSAVADVFTFLLVHGFNAKAVEEGRSFVRLGEQQFDESISLRDDVGDAGDDRSRLRRRGHAPPPGRPRDGRRLARDPAHAADGEGGRRRCTEHRPRGRRRRSVRGAGCERRGPGGDRGEDALIAGVERGVYVVDFWYTRILDPRTQVVTGLTRNGVWLIEDGRFARPIKNLRFTQSYAEALAPGAVRAVGRDAELLPGDFNSNLLVPSLHLASWNFTGGAKG